MPKAVVWELPFIVTQTWWFSWRFKNAGFVFFISICINHIFHSQVGSIFCWDEKVDRKKRWVVQFLLNGPTLNFWSAWWPVNHNFEACCGHKKVYIEVQRYGSQLQFYKQIYGTRKSFLFIMCMKALLSKDEIPVHKGLIIIIIRIFTQDNPSVHCTVINGVLHIELN